ncbi:sensor histidine kinase [Paludibaculum fermentans]|uniref:sensor histidine kinase n=1 Tax=Paludibaculum fermentans TaxID=1473598 RepID=UPI003EB9A125
MPKLHSPAARLALAVASVLLALLASRLMEMLQLRDAAVPLFLFALAITAWFGGPAAAAVALLLSCVSFDYYFVEPLHSLVVSPSDLPYFLVFSSFALLVTWFSSVRRRVEADLREALDKLALEVEERNRQASLLNLTHDTIFVRDMSDTITYWNRGAQELFGWTPEQAVGRQAHELLMTVFPLPIEEIRAELLAAGRWDGELEKTRSDGTRVFVASRWSLRRDELQRPVAILETNNDITDRKQREQEINTLNQELGKRTVELEAINKELEAFAYSISHDLRAPLRHMAGFTELLQKNAAPVLNDRNKRYVAMVLESAQRMGALIDDLLAFSRIGRAETRMTSVNLQQLVQEALAEVRPEAAKRDIVWTVGSLPSSYGDRSMLRLVFVNLVANAVKFTRTRPRSEIEIGCQGHADGQVVLFVRDNGVGFDMRYVNKLFGVFQRLHPPETFEGTGIGLATVQRIVHRHGGRVWAESVLDQGATFYFSLSTSKGV